MEKEDEEERELQFMPPTPTLTVVASAAMKHSAMMAKGPPDPPVLDLSLSISVGPPRPHAVEEAPHCARNMHALKQQTAEQIQLAAVERAYAERMRELTRRELEMAEKEFARARLVWERARQEVERVERMKEMATRRINSSCMEITCQVCRQRYRPL